MLIALRTRFLVALSMVLYAMLLGFIRTAMLGSSDGRKPGTGELSSGSDVSLSVPLQTHKIIHAASLSALGMMG